MNQLTEKERIEILMMVGYGERKRTHEEVANLFNGVNHNRNPISKSTVTKTLQRYRHTGSVQNRIIPGRPITVTNEENSLAVLMNVIEQPKTSAHQLALDHGMSRFSIQKILKTHKYHPYKIILLQELLADDFDRRLQFCEEMTEAIDVNNNFLNCILFSDESTFTLNGSVNRHNCRYYSDENPHWMEALHTQYPQKVNVWCGIIGEHIIGPFFIEGNLNSDKYLQLLQNNIIHRLLQLFPSVNNPNVIAENVWFHQDGATPHYARIVRNYLNQIFPGRWIGRRGSIEWPARSPDLTPLDFFLWGYLKNKVYVNRPADVDELKARIADEIAAIPQEYLRNSINEVRNRLHYCQEVNGQQFEQFIR